MLAALWAQPSSPAARWRSQCGLPGTRVIRPCRVFCVVAALTFDLNPLFGFSPPGRFPQTTAGPPKALVQKLYILQSTHAQMCVCVCVYVRMPRLCVSSPPNGRGSGGKGAKRGQNGCRFEGRRAQAVPIPPEVLAASVGTRLELFGPGCSAHVAAVGHEAASHFWQPHGQCVVAGEARGCVWDHQHRPGAEKRSKRYALCTRAHALGSTLRSRAMKPYDRGLHR